MKEDFLHYLWRNKKFDISNLQTISGEEIVILNSGAYLKQEGPDFFNSQLIIANQKWAGNVEIHHKSSDWYVHHHELDVNYDNVILHVVWEHDVDVYRKNNTNIPVLELKKYVSDVELEKYAYLFESKTWINCENDIDQVDSFALKKWQERLFLERLEIKTKSIQDFLDKNENDWEATFFIFLAKYFGLNVNGEAFLKIAKSIPFSIIRKEQTDLLNLEALLFGFANLLNEEKEDVYFRDLKQRWVYLKHKYKFSNDDFINLQFFKLRPDNFPTIRLSQLAVLYHANVNLFSKVIDANTLSDFHKLFSSEVSEYWKLHYVFDNLSKLKAKKLSKSFINLIVINTVIPVKFLFAKQRGENIVDDLIDLLIEIPSESNSVIDKFKFYKIKCNSAFDSQTLIHLKNEYCNHKKCLNCDIGLSLLK
ncbi:DUF2851 family protein [Flavobacterium sp.]|jgi:hypothetical protein|uniref:DUF2851 family protein n=1 Tax=Flavobacterium sp. TaxID=239 RepID=UPI002A821C5C|nr:DUF2851 family protein [Flavobacterium sp.]